MDRTFDCGCTLYQRLPLFIFLPSSISYFLSVYVCNNNRGHITTHVLYVIGTTWTQELVWLLVNNLDYDGAKVQLDVRFPMIE